MLYINRRNGIIVLDDYLDYLSKIEQRLPIGAREFVTDASHYDPRSPRCPHDSWVEHVSVVESGEGDRRQLRELSVHAKFFGAYHDGYFTLEYDKVSAYKLSMSGAATGGGEACHGDWIVDEIVLHPSGDITHEIEFSGGALWKIRCSDIRYTWIVP